MLLVHAMSSMTVSEQHILSNMSLNRSIHKRKSYIAADKSIGIRGPLEVIPIFPLGAKVQYSLIQGSW